MRSIVPCLLYALVTVAAATPAAQGGSAADGEKVYAAQKCAMCHAIGGKGNPKGPLDDVGSRLSAEEIRQWLLTPKVMEEKQKATRTPHMPAYTKVSRTDLESLVAYLQAQKEK